jgi:hypothetical protein
LVLTERASSNGTGKRAFMLDDVMTFFQILTLGFI